jgi:hypothetical protein
MFSIFENFNLVFNCFWRSKKQLREKELEKKIYHVSRQHKISVLPITPTFDIENLYPLTDRVELWNIFVIGNDKTYIMTQVKDPNITIPEAEDLLNRKANGILPDDLATFFDTIWDRTLLGRQLQFYIVWNGKLYFINTYPFFNGKRAVIGAILFMRAFETMPESSFALMDGFVEPKKKSTEDNRAMVAVQSSLYKPAPPPPKSDPKVAEKYIVSSG